MSLNEDGNDRCNHWLTGAAVGIPELLDAQCTREKGHPNDTRRKEHISGSEGWNDAAGEWR